MANPVQCDEHGAGEWAGHIVCGSCRCVYVLEDAPSLCACCGDQLLPDGDRSDFTGRVVCSGCARSLLETQARAVGV
jgi:hypothetical protein